MSSTTVQKCMNKQEFMECLRFIQTVSQTGKPKDFIDKHPVYALMNNQLHVLYDFTQLRVKVMVATKSAKSLESVISSLLNL